MSTLKLSQLRKTLTDTGARWKATTDPLQAKKKYQLGYRPGPNEQSLEGRVLLGR